VSTREKLEFVPVKIVPFDESALLLSRAPAKMNTIERYFVRVRGNETKRMNLKF
jgi:hypothetical protein